MTKPQIGEIVLFKIDPSDFGIWRPLLVTWVNDDFSVEGEVFFNWERDRAREWPVKRLFYRLDKENRTVEVKGVKVGEGVGEYRLRVEQKVEKLSEKLGIRPIPQPERALTPEKRAK